MGNVFHQSIELENQNMEKVNSFIEKLKVNHNLLISCDECDEYKNIYVCNFPNP